MTETVSVDEAQHKLPDLLARALAGNEVIITEHGTLVARLVPVVAQSKKKRVAGLNRGTISMGEDFDDPLPDELAGPGMKLLLDTHIFIWWADQPEKLSRAAR